MTNEDRDDLKLEIGDTGPVWREVVSILPKSEEAPDVYCDFCNHPNSVLERGPIKADYIIKVGHTGLACVCDWCIDPNAQANRMESSMPPAPEVTRTIAREHDSFADIAQDVLDGTDDGSGSLADKPDAYVEGYRDAYRKAADRLRTTADDLEDAHE